MKFESNVVQFERIHWKCDGECRRNGRNVINGRQRHLLSGGCGMRQYRPLLSFHSTRNELPPPLAPIRRPQCHRRGRPSNGVVRRCRRPQIFRRIFPSRSRRQFDGSADLHEICIESGGGAADSNGQSFVAEFRAEEAEAAIVVRLLAEWVENGSNFEIIEFIRRKEKIRVDASHRAVRVTKKLGRNRRGSFVDASPRNFRFDDRSALVRQRPEIAPFFIFTKCKFSFWSEASTEPVSGGPSTSAPISRLSPAEIRTHFRPISFVNTSIDSSWFFLFEIFWTRFDPSSRWTANGRSLAEETKKSADSRVQFSW